MIKTRALSAAAALVATLTLGAVATPVASAAPGGWANDTFSECSGSCTKGAARATIVWGNRSANVNGSVSDAAGDLHTTISFDAYAGNTFVDRETRTASGTTKSYNFAIGDPDLVGGINRIIINICTETVSGTDLCSGSFEKVRN